MSHWLAPFPRPRGMAHVDQLSPVLTKWGPPGLNTVATQWERGMDVGALTTLSTAASYHWNQETWAQSLASCVTLGKWYNPSEPLLLHFFLMGEKCFT